MQWRCCVYLPPPLAKGGDTRVPPWYWIERLQNQRLPAWRLGADRGGGRRGVKGIAGIGLPGVGLGNQRPAQRGQQQAHEQQDDHEPLSRRSARLFRHGRDVTKSARAAQGARAAARSTATVKERTAFTVRTAWKYRDCQGADSLGPARIQAWAGKYALSTHTALRVRAWTTI